ncbi:chymotrypsin-like elastase family member 2A [Lithobates pipiens]
MISLLGLALLVAGASSCGVSRYSPAVARVVNGEEVVPHSCPWQHNLDFGLSMQFECSQRYIPRKTSHMTKHCRAELCVDVIAPHVTPPSYNTYRVMLGKHDFSQWETGQKTISVVKLINHPNWNPNWLSGGHDISLLKLAEPVEFSDTIQPVCLPAPGRILEQNTGCYVTGWGNLQTNGPAPNTLQQGRLLVVDYNTCTEPDWWGTLVDTNMVCAGGDGIVSSFMGDSGGPLNCQSAQGAWEVHGVVSFGSSLGCNYYKKPSVFTRVSDFNSWISATIASN